MQRVLKAILVVGDKVPATSFLDSSIRVERAPVVAEGLGLRVFAAQRSGLGFRVQGFGISAVRIRGRFSGRLQMHPSPPPPPQVSSAFLVCLESLRAVGYSAMWETTTRTGSRPLFHFLRVGVPQNPLKTKKGTLFIPRQLPGLDKSPIP